MAKQFEKGKRYRFSTKAFIDCMGFYPSDSLAELEGKVVFPNTKRIGICEGEDVHRDWCEEVEEEYKAGDIVEANGGYSFDPVIGEVVKTFFEGCRVKVLRHCGEEVVAQHHNWFYDYNEIIGKATDQESYKPKRKNETIEIRKNGKVVFEGKGQVKIKRNSKFESSNMEAYENGVSDFEINSGTTDKIYLEIKRGDDK